MALSYFVTDLNNRLVRGKRGDSEDASYSKWSRTRF
jgi:hypothetical protein